MIGRYWSLGVLGQSLLQLGDVEIIPFPGGDSVFTSVKWAPDNICSVELLQGCVHSYWGLLDT